MKFYHYTLVDRFIKIVQTGHLKLTPSVEKLHEGESQAVWLTSKDEWDDTAFYGAPYDVLDQIGRVRLTLEEVPKVFLASYVAHRLGDWESLTWSANLINVDPSNWYVTFEPIDIEYLTGIDIYIQGTWVPLEEIYESKQNNT